VATAIDVSIDQHLIREFQANTVPFFVVNRVHGFAGPLPELFLVQRLSDLMSEE
jgi:predicted DsbA family dithiol-disulfide isomerase